MRGLYLTILFVYKTMNKVIFLDRDGVINLDDGYTHYFKSSQVINECIDLIKFANSKQYKVIIVTNQSGIGRGYYLENTFHQFMSDMVLFLRNKGAVIDDYFYAPYYKYSKNSIYTQNKNLRKPNVGMLQNAFIKHNLRRESSILVGDKLSDIQAGNNFGINSSILYDNKFKSPKRSFENMWVVNNLKYIVGLPIW